VDAFGLMTLNGLSDGEVVAVTLTKVVDPGTPADEFSTPQGGDRLAGTQFRLANALRVLGLNHVGGQAEPTCGALVPSQPDPDARPAWLATNEAHELGKVDDQGVR
jgi:hypothetical protein